MRGRAQRRGLNGAEGAASFHDHQGEETIHAAPKAPENISAGNFHDLEIFQDISSFSSFSRFSRFQDISRLFNISSISSISRPSHPVANLKRLLRVS